MHLWPTSHTWFHNAHETAVQLDWEGVTRTFGLVVGVIRDGLLVGVTYHRDRVPWQEGVMREHALHLYLLVCCVSMHIDRYDASATFAWEEDDD